MRTGHRVPSRCCKVEREGGEKCISDCLNRYSILERFFLTIGDVFVFKNIE